MLISCRYESVVAKPTALQISHCTESEVASACISLNIHNIKKNVEINVVELGRIIHLHPVLIIHMTSCF